jgi:biotin synthesis protein BioG
MKQVYIIHEHHPRLLLFFAGWGADETPFKEYRPAESDFMICYDYRTLDFNATELKEYREINVIGWSMGVWAATRVMPQLALPIATGIAINGTPYPSDERFGIPPAIFRGTLDGLTGASLHKFLRRMCADGTAFRAFLEVTPRRPLEELREELERIEENYKLQITNYKGADKGIDDSIVFHWQQAVIGSADRIIPPANQLQAWQKLGTPVRQTEDAHYQEEIFRYYLQDLWTNS